MKETVKFSQDEWLKQYEFMLKFAKDPERLRRGVCLGLCQGWLTSRMKGLKVGAEQLGMFVLEALQIHSEIKGFLDQYDPGEKHFELERFKGYKTPIYKGTLGEVVDGLLEDGQEGFYVIGVPTPGGGHAIGVCVAQKGKGLFPSTYVFDPNFGEAVMKRKQLKRYLENHHETKYEAKTGMFDYMRYS